MCERTECDGNYGVQCVFSPLDAVLTAQIVVMMMYLLFQNLCDLL